MVKGAAGRRLLAPGALHLDRRIGRTLAVYLVVITVIVGYNARAIADQRGSALSVNVAARQRALAERYEKDVILTTLGIQADPGADAQQLLANADALLHGGEVLAVQGADEEIRIRPASHDRLVVAKLEEENRLIQELIAVGDDLYPMRVGQPGYQEALRNLRIVGAQVTSISNDAVGQMTRETESALARLVAVVITLGVLGAFAALAMAWFLRKTAARRAAQFRSLVHNASDLITVLDVSGEIRYQSPSALQLVGMSSEELIGTSYMALLDENDGARLRSILADLATSADPSASATAEYRLRHQDGSWRSVESIVSNQTTDPTVKGLVLNTRDVTDRKLLQEELAQQAFHDSLTGLSNRAVFRDRVDHALARATRTGSRSAVFILDLDGFKTVNDSLGHDAGDQLLIAAAQRLQFQGRSSDTVARIGGDEFGILLEDDADETSARAMADRLLAAFSVPFEVRGRELFVRATIGIALSVAGESNTDEMIRNADTAMYAAKAAGKARLRGLPPVHARACPRALRGAGRSRGRLDPPRVRRPLPADRRLRDREGAGRRGARALEPSDPRAARAPRVHPHRRRHGGHRSAGSLGARPGVPADRRVACRAPGGIRPPRQRQPQHAAAAGARPRRTGPPDPRGERAGTGGAHAGADGGQPHAEDRGHGHEAARVEGAGRSPRDRRLRHGLLVARLPATVPDRHLEDRQVVRRRDRHPRFRGSGAGARDRGDGEDAAPGDGGRGHRGDRAARRALDRRDAGRVRDTCSPDRCTPT